MEFASPRIDYWRGGAIAAGVCVLSLGLGARVQEFTGNAGPLVGFLLATAIASWYAGRWAGLLTTGVGAVAAAYFVFPPANSLAIFEPRDFGALYSFAIGGIIISLLCGAAWQLRVEARFVQATGDELARLHSLNSSLHHKAHRQDIALAASDRLLREFARSARTVLEAKGCANEFSDLARQLERVEPFSPGPVDCNTLLRDTLIDRSVQASLPTVWADERDMRRLFQTLLTPQSVELTASQLPEWWLLVAVFRGNASPLSQLEYCASERIIVRQGGRCWSNLTGSGDWELRFLLPRHAPPSHSARTPAMTPARISGIS